MIFLLNPAFLWFLNPKNHIYDKQDTSANTNYNRPPVQKLWKKSQSLEYRNKFVEKSCPV